MKKLILCAASVALALVLAAPAHAWSRSASVARVRSVERVRVQQVQKVQQVKVQQVKVQQVVQVQKVQQVVQVQKVQQVKIAQVVTPYVQVSQVAYCPPAVQAYYAAPVVAYQAPLYYGQLNGNGADNQRLDRLERNLERLTELQTQMLQSLRVQPLK